MPSKTPEQARAMQAACHGNSTLGIPKGVGCEFAKADMEHARSNMRGHLDKYKKKK